MESPLIQIVQRPGELLRQIGRGRALIEAEIGRWFEQFTGLVVTSANALDSLRDVFERFPGLAALLPCFVVGARSAKEAQKLGLRVIHPPEVKTAHHLAVYLSEQRDIGPTSGMRFQEAPRRLLWLRGSLADLSFKHYLEETGFVVEDVVCYDTVAIELSRLAWDEVRAGRGVVVFYSPSAVSAFLGSPVVQEHPLQGELDVIAIGPTTAKALSDAGVSGVFMALEPRLEGVIDTLLKVHEKTYQRRDSSESTR